MAQIEHRMGKGEKSRDGRIKPRPVQQSRKAFFPNPNSLKSRLKRLFTFNQADSDRLPLVCLGRLLKRGGSPEPSRDTKTEYLTARGFSRI